jgi:hypothetical protein
MGESMRRRALLLSVVSASGWLLVSRAILADAPPCRYTVGADTVVDRVTGLTWQRAVSAATYDLAAAKNYCQHLPLKGGGWRLPSSAELESLVDRRAIEPTIDVTAFPNTPSEGFWSSTALAGDAGSGWCVFFDDGRTRFVLTSDPARVRCVR